MVGVESANNVKNSLNYAKQKYNLNPSIITSDFSPQVVGPVCEVFGEEKLQIDGFHVMQELNNGIRRDLLDFRKKHFQIEIRELIRLRNSVSSLQLEYKTTKTLSKKQLVSFSSISSAHHRAYQCLQTINGFLKIHNTDNAELFAKSLKRYLTNLENKNPDFFREFSQSIKKTYPKRVLTEKGRYRLTNEVLKRFKSLFLNSRSKLEQKSLEFYKNHWIIFFQPENMTKERHRRLLQFLSTYPSLQEYRDMTLGLGEIYRRNITEIDGKQIDKLIIKDTYSSKLQTAIKTIKKFKSSILRFVVAFKGNPELSRACRANMEYFNRNFKAPFRQGLNCTSQSQLHAKLQFQLGCEVRFLLENVKKPMRRSIQKT